MPLKFLHSSYIVLPPGRLHRLGGAASFPGYKPSLLTEVMAVLRDLSFSPIRRS